jgi:hypothetical protein
MKVLGDAEALIEIAWSDPSSTKIPAFSHEEWRHPNTRDENESKKTDPKQSRAEPKTIHAILDVAAEMMRISCPTIDVEAPADQAQIPGRRLSPVASHDLFGFLNS